MDTEAIALEIVELKNRIAALEVEGNEGTDVDDEKNELHERMRILQDQLSGRGPKDEPKHETEADRIQFIAPA
jgi:hypothetical protein